ncbi:metal-sulfur cluster assembly factor [Thermocatellispora tengchongensis]|uniref:metal-sulfur cluster assembly factor n=1 Tax=Thermocatellispora tengchongensis TaxID=1073253 RepID=UPI00363C6635
MITEAEVRARLNTVIDPCSRAAGTPGGLDDLGLIRRVEVSGEPGALLVRVVIGVTEYGCVMGAPFAGEAYRLLADLDGVAEVRVELDEKFDWVPDDMSPAYRERLEQAHRRPQAAQPGGARPPLLTMERRT